MGKPLLTEGGRFVLYFALTIWLVCLSFTAIIFLPIVITGQLGIGGSNPLGIVIAIPIELICILFLLPFPMLRARFNLTLRVVDWLQGVFFGERYISKSSEEW